MRTLYPQQRAAVDFMLTALRTHRSALNSSETGTGKTLMAVVAAREIAPPRLLVVCPKAVITPWEDTLREQGVQGDVINYEKLRTGKSGFLTKTGKKTFRFTLPEGSLIVWDESHRLKSWDSQNSMMSVAATQQGMLSMFASATPFRDPTEMKAHGLAFGLFKLHEYWNWCRLMGVEKDHWGKMTFVLDEESSPKLGWLSRWMYSQVAVRLTRADLADHFQECSISWEPRTFRDQAAIAKAYTELGDALELLEIRKSMDGMTPAVVTKILRARQKVELLKLATIAEMAEDALEEGMSVFIALCFRDSVEAMQKLLGDGCSIIIGGQSKTERDRAVEDFQSGKTRVCIANIDAGGVGISLHDTTGDHPRLALISPSFDEKSLKQALGRVDRAGAKTPSIQRIMVAAGTVEVAILNSLKEKLAISDLTHAQDGESSGQMTETTATPPAAAAAPVTEERPAHAEFGPSALKNYVACAGYLPSSGDSAASLSGTRIHLALETGDNSGLVDEEELSKAAYCRAAVDKIKSREGVTAEAEDFREIVFDIVGTGAETFGTLDRLFVMGDKGVAIDYKTGNWSVDEPEDNWQAKAYALGAFQMFPELKQIAFYFILPARDEITYGLFQRTKVPELMDTIGYYVDRAKRTRRFAERGEYLLENFNVDLNKQCLFCARVTADGSGCPKMNGVAFEAIRRYTTDVELPANLETTALSVSKDHSPETMTTLLRLGAILEKMAAAWKALAKEMIQEEGIEIPGYVMKPRAGTREITNIKTSIEVAKQYGVTLEAYMEALGKVSVTQWEDLIKTHTKKGDKTKMVQAALADLYEAGALAQKDETFVLTAVRK